MLHYFLRSVKDWASVIFEVKDNIFSDKRDLDAPLVISFNPLWNKFGKVAFWEYEYVSGVLTKSKIHWKKLKNKDEVNTF